MCAFSQSPAMALVLQEQAAEAYPMAVAGDILTDLPNLSNFEEVGHSGIGCGFVVCNII